MRRFCFALAAGILGIVLVSGGSGAQEKTKIRGQLPSGWKALMLDKSQVLKIYTIQTDFRKKYQDLEKQMEDLKAQEKQELVKVLTEDQKKLLIKLVVGEETKAKPKVKSKNGD